MHAADGLGDDAGFGGRSEEVGESFLAVRFCQILKQKQRDRHACLSFCFLGTLRANKREKLVARLLIVAEAAEHSARHRLAVLFFDAAHLHAQVTRFNDHANAFRADFFLNGRGDLAGEALLNLQATREHIDEARYFAEADDALIGQIGDVALTKKRQ